MSMAIALLHTGARISPAIFSVHPSTVIGIIGLAALYERGARVAARADDGKSAAAAAPRRHHRVCYYTGLATMFLALNGWLHDLSDTYLFSAHMVQHLLLALVVAPLLVMGLTAEMLRPVLALRGIGPVARWVTSPVRTFAIFNVVVAAWHLPPLYNFALAHHPVHIVQHLMFMSASVIMWWPFLSPLPELPRLAYPGQMLYCFLMVIPMSIVAIYIAMADHILYPAYSLAPRVWNLTPMSDQQIGGLIMWIPGGLLFYVVMTFVFFKWAGRDSDTTAGAQVDWRPPRPVRPPPRPTPSVTVQQDRSSSF